MSSFMNLMNILKTNRQFVDDDGELVLAAVQDHAWAMDHDLIRLLLSDHEIKGMFFEEIDGCWVFNNAAFVDYISEKSFLDNSYTRFRNRIGLKVGGKFLREGGDVSLVWPYKDCVLEGGQTKEEETRKEIFFNEVLAQDEINRLFDPKVLTNFARYTDHGKEDVAGINRDERGVIRENLIIRGNNLIALHSIKSQFVGEIKLIYIDPPYNLGGDSFGYNDNFNQSSWLTFMKNRLEIASKLLRKDGAIFVQIDLHELGYLQVLMDEIFGVENRVQIIAVRTASPAGFKTVNPGPIDVTEYILFYTKDRKSFKFKRNYVATNYDENYSLYIENIAESPENWRLIPLRDVVYQSNGIELGQTVQASNANARAMWGDHWKAIRSEIISQFALDHADRIVSIRDPHKPSAKLREALAASKLNPRHVLVLKRTREDEELNEDERTDSYLYNGGAISFYSNKVVTIDGEKTPSMLLTDFWNDLSWDGIAKEGGVKLKNGKKPERLIKRIIEMSADRGDIVLDYHLGSGTTAAVAHKLGLQYIGIEQIDYGDNDSVKRLVNVIQGDESGISKFVDWHGGGNFIYCELAKYNETFMDRILSAQSSNELVEIAHEMAMGSFLNWYINPTIPDEALRDLEDIGRRENGLDIQKRLISSLLDKNQLYLNLTEIDDSDFHISEEDKRLNKAFYGETYNA
jgi:adenine-specific DNA-methyltransferase